MVRRPAGPYVPPNKKVGRLLDRITDTLRDYLDQGGTRTDLLRAVGNYVADLRGQFTRNDAPDWSGRSREYQYAMSEVYDRLGVKGKQRENLQFSVRFHAGNVIRGRADADELEAAGLDAVSPRERILRTRATQAATAGAVGIQAGAAESLPKALAWAATLLEYATSLDAGGLTAKERAAGRALIQDCRDCLDTLAERL
ncbi:hypothetical protein [Streptomyces sp. NPDC003952]